MIELSRSVRFCLNGDGSLANDLPVANSFSAWPPMRGLGRYFELTLTCAGEPDPQTGYFLNIKQIDYALRDHVLPKISQTAQQPQQPLGQVMQDVLETVADPLDDCAVAAQLQLTPFHWIRIEKTAMDEILLTQTYEFAAAHRLHSPDLTPEQNRAIYGKCNNPAGHGHNYKLEVTVRCPVDAEGNILPVEKLDETVDAHVIEKLDHKNLDCDVSAFAERTTSVEHISQAVYNMLEEPVRKLGVTLDAIRVWETTKTSCLYRPAATAPHR